METGSYKISCPYCDCHIEFSTYGIDEVAPCPNCGRRLHLGDELRGVHRRFWKFFWITAGIAAVFAVIVAAVIHARPAQREGAGSRTILVTNWLNPSPGLRLVNGNLYDADRSTDWDNLYNLQQRVGDATVHPFRSAVTVVEVGPHSVLCLVESPGVPEYTKHILVKNPPNLTELTTGQQLPFQWRVLRVGTFQYGRETIEAYDYGSPYTNKVPVVQHAEPGR